MAGNVSTQEGLKMTDLHCARNLRSPCDACRKILKEDYAFVESIFHHGSKKITTKAYYWDGKLKEASCIPPAYICGYEEHGLVPRMDLHPQSPITPSFYFATEDAFIETLWDLYRGPARLQVSTTNQKHYKDLL